MQKVKAVIEAAVADLLIDGNPADITVGLGWPDVERLQDVARGKMLISVHERLTGKVPRRYLNQTQQFTPLPCGIAAVLSNDVIGPTGSETLTLSFSVGSSAVNQYDGVGLGAAFGFLESGATVIASTGNSLHDVASALATNINATDVLSDWISASATGAVVTLTNLLSAPLKIAKGVGNRTIRTKETGREQADLQITLWADSQKSRYSIGDIIQPLLNDLEDQGRVQINAGDHANFGYNGSMNNDADVQKNTYRREFLLSAEYSVRKTDFAYPVLAQIHTYNNPRNPAT